MTVHFDSRDMLTLGRKAKADNVETFAGLRYLHIGATEPIIDIELHAGDTSRVRIHGRTIRVFLIGVVKVDKAERVNVVYHVPDAGIPIDVIAVIIEGQHLFKRSPMLWVR